MSQFLFALWLGIGVGVSFVAIPVVFAFKATLPPGVAGTVAQAILLRYFGWQAVIAAVATILYAIEYARDRRNARRLRAWVLPAIMAASLIALFWLHPRMAALHAERYTPTTPEPRRQQVAGEFARWHGAAQAANLAVLIGVLACSCSVSQAVGSCAGRSKGVSPAGL